MKKLSLKDLKLEADEMLQRNQLKTVLGGDYGNDGGGTCGYKHPNGSTWCNISYYTAYNAYLKNGGNWCCDSCSSASYC